MIPPIKSFIRFSVFRSALAAVTTAFLATPAANAVTQTWNNASGGDWNTPADWNTAQPGSGDTALFNIAISEPITNASAVSIGSITFDAAAGMSSGSFLLGSTLTPAFTLANAGTIQILSTLTNTGEAISINAPIVLTPGSTTTAGSYTFTNNAGPTDTLNFGGQISASTTNNTETLTLSGTNTGNNTISGNIVNGSATTFAVTKSGAGTWVLTGANTYNGTTTVSAGTLNISGTNSGSGATTVSGGTLIISGTDSDSGGTTITSGTENLTGAITGAGAITVSRGGLTEGGTGVIGSAAATLNLTGGNVTLSGLNTYTGNTTVTTGSLTLDFSNAAAPLTATNIIKSGNTLIMDGGSFTLKGGGAGAVNSQTFGTVYLNNFGNSEIGVTQNSATTVNLAMGAFNREGQGTADFTLPTSGSITTTAGGPQGLIGYASANGGATWATYASTSGTVGAIGALSSYSTGDANYLAANDIDVTNGDSVSGVTVDSLRFNSAAETLTLAGSNYVNTGILVTPSATGSTLITGGTLTSSSPDNELVLLNYGSVNLASVIADNGTPTSLTIGGTGTTVLSGANTYTGNTNLAGGTLNLNGSPLSLASLTGGANAIVALGSSTLTINNGVDSTAAFLGNFTGSGSIIKNGPGALILSSTAAAAQVYGDTAFTGSFTVNDGWLISYNEIGASPGATVHLGAGTGSNPATIYAISGNADNANPIIVNGGGTGALTFIANTFEYDPITLSNNPTLTLSNFGYNYLGQTVNTGVFSEKGGVTGTGNILVANNSNGDTLQFYNAPLNFVGSFTAMTLGATTAGAVTIGSDNADGLGVNVTALVQASDGGGTLLYAPTNYTAGSALTGFDGAISTVAGVLQANLTNSTTGIFGPASTLSVGGGDFQLINTTASTTKSQVLNGLTVNPGSSTIDVDNGSTSLTLDLRGSGGTDGITRNTGGTVNFIATAGSVGSTSIVYTDQANDAGGILGGWATVSGTTWATNNGGNIVVGLPTASYNTAALATGTSDVDVIGSATLGGNANTLRFNSAGVDALTISNTSALTDGGILVTANVGANISTISGGAIEGALGVDLVVDQFDTSAGLAISSTIADNTNPTALTKSGPGLLSLTNPANTYSGTTYINAGTLNIAAAGSLGSGAFELNGGTLQYTGGSAVNLTPGYTLTTAGGGFDSSGAGSLTISGNMTVSGASSTQGGAQLLTLTGSNNGGIGTLSGTINNGGGNSDYTAVTKTGAGEWVLSGANTYTGFTTITSGTLVAENVSALGNLNGTNVVNPALVVMNGGTLDIATDTSIDPYDVVMPVASTIVTDRLTPGSPGITQTLGYLAIGSNNLTVNAGSNVSGGTPMLAFGQVNLTGNPDIISNTANVTLANVQGTAAVGTTYTLTLTNNTGGLSYITGNISNGGSGGLVGLTKSGTGVLILDGTNTFTGPTSVTAGVLNVQNNEALGTGLGMSTSSVSVSNGGVLQLQGGITTAASVLLSLNGAGLTGALNGALESVSGNNTYTGPIFLAGTGISIGNDTAGTTLTLSNPGTMTTSNNGTLVLIGAGNITIDSNIGTGSGGVTDSSPGLLTLAGTGTYTGATALSSGTTTITGALGNTAVTVGAATLQLNNTSAINQNTLTVNNANSVVTETVGGIGGSAALAESNGLVTLSQSNSYTGATTLSGSGTLNINNAGALGATASTFNINGGTIDNTSGAAITLTANQPITLGGNFGYSTAAGTINNSINFGTGAVANSGSRTITLNGAGVLTFGGIMTNTAGAANTLTISLGNNTTSTSAVSFGGYALSNNGTSYIDVIGGRGNVDITGPVTNGGTSTASGLTWTGNGILTLSGSNTYGGATTIGGGGTVDLANQYAVQNSTVTMQPYGSALVFDSSVSGNAFTFGGLAAASNGPGYDIALQDNAITPDPVALTVGGNNASTVYAGYLSGGGSLTKVGTGNLTLTGVSTYAGATTVNGGTLQLGNGGTTGNIPGNLTMATGATLIDDQTGASDPIAGVFTPNGGALTVDTGTLVLNSTNIPDGTTNAFGYLTVAANTELVFDPATTSTNSFTGVTQGADTILSFEAGTNTLSGSYWPQSGPTALYLTGGILNISFILPYGGTYGYIGMAGGSMNNGISMGRPAGSYSVLDLSSGSINAPSGGGGVSITMSNNAVINQTGGSIINTNDGTVDVANTAGTTAVFNLSGGTVGQPASGGYYKLVVGNNAAATGIVNLDGGVFYAYSVAGLSSSLSSLNFNGGTLVAGNAGTFWNANEVPGYIYGGGATINDGGLSITIAQSLLAPTGDGVTGLPAISSSTGFIGSPVVVISGGSGSGATAVADFDSATGTITGLTITNPGTGYLPGDTLTVSLVGGTAVTGTTVLGMATLGANTSGGLTKTGAGVLTLSGTDSTYTGPTTVNAGTLEYTNDNALPLASSAIDVNNAGSALAVRFGGGSDFTAAQIASLLSSGTINFGANTAFGIDTTDASGIYSNILSMPVGLIKLGANILTLTGPNTYTGVTTLAGGELNVGVAENPGVSGPLGTDTAVGAIVLTGGTLQYSSANQYDYSARFSTGANQDYNVDTNSQAITWATALTSSGGELTKSGAGSLTLTGANTYTGATTLTTGTLTFAGAGTLPSGSGVNVGNGTLLRILNDGTGNNGTISLGNNVTAIGSVTSTINVGHNSANTGNTVALGTLSTGAATVGNATTFDFTGTNGYLVSFTNLLLPGVAGQGTTLNPTTTSVTILGNVTNQMTSQSGNNYDTLTLEGSTAGNAIDGVISDSAIYTGTVGGGDTRITVNGAGVTWALNGANTYHGPTTVSAGTLQLGNASALGNTSTVTVSSGAVLDLGGQTVTGTSPLTINGTGIATGGALINSSVTPASYAGSVALGSNSDIGGTGATTLNGVVSGGFSLTKVGSGTLTITSTGSYTGATNVLGGTLIVSGSLSGTSAVNLDPSTLEVDGAIKAGATISSTASTVEGTGIVGNITLTGASNLAPGLTSAGVVAGGTLSAANVVFSDTASSLSITLGQASADDSTLLALSGSASLNDTPLNLTLGGAFSGAQPGMVYTILTGLASSGMGSGTDAFTINGAVVDDGQSFADGLDTFSISYNDGTDVQLELTGVPEPGTWTMLIAGAGMLIAFQRKRRH